MNSMADNQKVYQAIKTIADELCKENKTYLRADLAFELKKYGIASDSSEVSKLVFDAYRYFHDNGNIAIAFVSNNSRTTLVAEYKLNDSLEQGNKEEALKIAETELALSSSALEQLKEQVELNLNLVLAKGTSKMADIVMGTNGVKDVRSKASTMFDKYTKMVEAYHYAEDSVRGNIEDFTSLRSDIGTVYRDYALKLIDIYGDSIKMVSPDLFDFKRIEWLDVDEMLKYVELEYNKLTEKCAALIGEISVSFRTSLQGSLQAYKSLSNGNKSLGLAMAGLTMLEHYMGASERANRLKSDLSVFQMSVKHDATRIKADMGRLLVICKTLNDVVIPKANVFLRYGEKLLASDLKATLDALYADETIRPLEEQRKCLLQQMKVLDMEMNDHLQNIDVYTSLINDITATLESKQGSYMDAKAKKPSKPFFLVNWITFGMANKNYYRDFTEWNAVCFPLVREYESYQVDLKLDKEELESHREEQTRIKNEYAKLSSELDKVSKEIRSKIVCSDELKLKMLKHLRDMVAMLKLGREIMESHFRKRIALPVVLTPEAKKQVAVLTKKQMKRNRFFLISLLFASSITVHAQDNAPKDSLTMESMMHNLPEVMVKGSRPIVKVERGMLTYNMPLLIKQLPADNAYEALTHIPGISDATGKISFSGNEVTLIVNGQATTLTQEQLTERLKAMPAAQLAKAEVMLSAPARYHVRGMAINIVTKDYAGTNQLSGQAIGGLEQNKYAKGFGDFNLSLQRGKFGMDAQYKYVDGYSYGEHTHCKSSTWRQARKI